MVLVVFYVFEMIGVVLVWISMVSTDFLRFRMI